MAEPAIATSPLSSVTPSPSPIPFTFSQQTRQWRQSRDLPFELAQHVQIYFEESMFMQAYHLLFSIVSSDASTTNGTITVPPPTYLALTATLVVHPTVTTRTTSVEKWEQANSALRLLRLLQKTAGPINSHFKDAFRFTKYDSIAAQDGNEDSSHYLNHSFAQEDSIWNQADDFWSVIGWTLNCSCLTGMYATRWSHWQLWLEFVVEVLETDWQFHQANDSSKSSLLWHYIEHAQCHDVRGRRIVRAVFANGSTNSLNEFRTIFRRELKEPKQLSDRVAKREAVDIDNDVYGDYLLPDDDDSDASSIDEPRSQKRARTRAPSARRLTPKASNQSLRVEFEEDAASNANPATSPLGPPEAISIRLRLLQLLVQVSAHPTLTRHGSTTFPDLTDLFTLYVEFIKPLPLPAFQQIITPPTLPSGTGVFQSNGSTDEFSNRQFYSSLSTFLLQRLLETTSTPLANPHAPPPNQSALETHYLPHAANKPNPSANARVSLCLESLVRILGRENGALVRTRSLEQAVQQGIERREEKAREKERDGRGRREGGSNIGNGDGEDWKMLVESGMRLRSCLRFLTT